MEWFNWFKAKLKGKEVSEVEEYSLKDKEVEKLSELFVSRDEKYIASLGNGYIMNFLVNKSINKGFAFITDKRVYFKGSCLSGTGKNLVKTNEERTIDVKDITGSGFTYHRYWGILLAMFVSVIAALAGAVCTALFGFEEYDDYNIFDVFFSVLAGDAGRYGYYLLVNFLFNLVSMALFLSLTVICCVGIKNYLFKRKTLFRIEYAGGCIAFDASFYAKAEIDDFQKQLRRAKDMAEESAIVKTVTKETSVEVPAQSHNAENLRKYAELLKDGLITQEEYDAMKKKVLGL